MNAGLWATIGHLKEEESLVTVQWAEDMRHPVCQIETAKRRSLVQKKVNLV